MLGHIYKITNLINNKVYIGQTIQTIEKRFIQHKSHARTGNNNHKLANALRKYGEDNFIVENIEDCEQELLDEIRKHVSDDKARVEIRQKINKFESYLYGDFDAILRRIYRLGVVDGYKLKREIKDIIDED